MSTRPVIARRDRDVCCINPLERFADQHKWYAAVDKFLWHPSAVYWTVLLAIAVGAVLKWVS